MIQDRQRELIRKALHMGVGLLAFAIPFLGPLGTLGLALALVAFNAAVLPRIGGRRLWRAGERERGAAAGIVAYPLALVALVLIFWRRLEVVAAVWGILAFGDGMATVAGTRFGRRALPWNGRKSWAGSLAFWCFGGAAAAVLLAWTSGHLGRQGSPAFFAAAAGLAALFAAWLESQPQGLDDNLTVPVPTGCVLFGLLLSQGAWSGGLVEALPGRAAAGLAINAVLAGLAWRLRAVDRSGALAGGVLGTLIYAFLGWRGFAMLGAFLVLGTAATRLGFERKAAADLAQAAGGRRSARNAVANAGVATLAAVFAATTSHADVYLPAFAAALAAAAGDTLSSEVGQLAKGRTVLITTFERVPPGTDGGVSVLGSVAGVLGSAAIAALGWASGLYPPAGIAAVIVAGTAGVAADSVLGATLERRGLLDNEGVNFAATFAAALAAGVLAG